MASVRPARRPGIAMRHDEEADAAAARTPTATAVDVVARRRGSGTRPVKSAVPMNRKMAGSASRPPCDLRRVLVGDAAAEEHAGHAAEDDEQRRTSASPRPSAM